MEEKLTDYQIGRLRFRLFQAYYRCQNDEQRKGWNDAENEWAWKVWKDGVLTEGVAYA